MFTYLLLPFYFMSVHISDVRLIKEHVSVDYIKAI